MAETEPPPYPPIDPTNFDLIVIGTGLPSSLIAAAASSAGKSVLHVDPNPFYGSHFSSLNLLDLTFFLSPSADVITTNNKYDDNENIQNPNSADVITESGDVVNRSVNSDVEINKNKYDDDVVIQKVKPDSDDVNTRTADVITRSIYSDVEISKYGDVDVDIKEQSRRFSLDLCGPRVLFCADVAVEMLLKCGANQYVEFKNIDASYVGDESGELVNVPDSKSAVFKDRTLKYSEKNQLNSFFKLVQGHLESVKGGGGELEGRVISDEDLESPFVLFLDKIKLPSKIKSIILYAIAMVDYDQDAGESCKNILKTRDGIERLALYHSSVGRFPNALGALLYPIYGQGELPQAFCRHAAVKGCLYVLRMPVISVLLNEDGGSYRGVKLVSGQELTSHKLVIDPSLTIRSSLANSPSEDVSNVFDVGAVSGKVARGICITKSSLKPDTSNCLVIYPPRSLYPDQASSIRVLQLGSNLAVCPSGMFVSYLSVLCDDATEGKKSLHAAMDRLFSVHTSGTIDSSSTDQTDSTEMKPSLLWSALYIQDLIEGSMGPGRVVRTPTPDGNLNYNDLLSATSKLFQKLYPDDEFLPEVSYIELSDNLEDDGEVMES